LDPVGVEGRDADTSFGWEQLHWQLVLDRIRVRNFFKDPHAADLFQDDVKWFFGVAVFFWLGCIGVFIAGVARHDGA